MTAMPPEVVIPHVLYYFQDGILFIGFYGDSGSIAQPLHQHVFCLGLTVQVASREQVTAQKDAQAQPAQLPSQKKTTEIWPRITGHSP